MRIKWKRKTTEGFKINECLNGNTEPYWTCVEYDVNNKP